MFDYIFAKTYGNMNEILNKIIGWVSKDGYIHFSASCLLCLTLSLFAPLGLAAFIAALCGLCKAFFVDYLLNVGEISKRDLILDAAGILYAIVIFLFIV